MSTEKLYLVSATEDGCYIEEISEAAIQNELAQGDRELSEFKSRIPKDSAMVDDWGTSSILIRGRIVVPEPVTRVTEFRIPD